mmetsp:Transcript_26613/g.55240  ORF Transcript_26613/g.55240 Transcript_26613/m.55240 type:complete len:177 (-) Transcript_26613:6-536(-)
MPAASAPDGPRCKRCRKAVQADGEGFFAEVVRPSIFERDCRHGPLCGPCAAVLSGLTLPFCPTCGALVSHIPGAPAPAGSHRPAQQGPSSQAVGNGSVRHAPWRWPPGPPQDEPELDSTLAGIRERLRGLGAESAEDRLRLLRPLFLEWHPDKRPQDQELATKVFQWLQLVKEVNT